MYTIYDLHSASLVRKGKTKFSISRTTFLHIGIVEELSDKAVEILVKAHKKLDQAKIQDLCFFVFH